MGEQHHQQFVEVSWAGTNIQVIKGFSKRKQMHVGMELSKTSQTRDGNDNTSHHPHILSYLQGLEAQVKPHKTQVQSKWVL